MQHKSKHFGGSFLRTSSVLRALVSFHNSIEMAHSVISTSNIMYLEKDELCKIINFNQAIPIGSLFALGEWLAQKRLSTEPLPYKTGKHVSFDQALLTNFF